MKYFGTDGIRGIANKSLNKNLIIKVANAIVRFLVTKLRKCCLLETIAEYQVITFYQF